MIGRLFRDMAMPPHSYATAFGGIPGAGPCTEITSGYFKRVLGGWDQLAMVRGGAAPVSDAMMIIRCLTQDGNLDWTPDAQRLLVAIGDGFKADAVVSPSALASKFDLSSLQEKSSLHGSKAIAISGMSSADLYLLGLRDYRRWQKAQDKEGASQIDSGHLESLYAEIEACHAQNCFDAIHAIRRWSAIPDGQWAVTLSSARRETIPMFVGSEVDCSREYERAKGALWSPTPTASD